MSIECFFKIYLIVKQNLKYQVLFRSNYGIQGKYVKGKRLLNNEHFIRFRLSNIMVNATK